jgi:hypothetical protein
MQKLVMLVDGNPVAEYPVYVDESGLQSAGKEAFAEFRKHLPQISFFDPRVSFRLEELK